MTKLTLPRSTHIGCVDLRVSSLDHSLAFYGELLGFREIPGGSGLSASGEPPALITLTEQPNTVPRPKHTTGLFHIAIRLPDAKDLARELRRLLEDDWPVHGLSDHGVSEAVYLSDPDGNGIELYADKPMVLWPRENGAIAMTTEPLDPNDLLEELTEDTERWSGINPATDMGHIHLQVSDLARSEEFYHGLLGLDVTQRNYPGALFLSAGGYHHHIGLNVWSSAGASTPPANAVGLISFALVVPDEETWMTLRKRVTSAGLAAEDYESPDYPQSFLTKDPDGIGVEIAVEL